MICITKREQDLLDCIQEVDDLKKEREILLSEVKWLQKIIDSLEENCGYE